jgi:hypothetical protein
MYVLLAQPFPVRNQSSELFHYDCLLYYVIEDDVKWTRRYQFVSRKTFKHYHDCKHEIEEIFERNKETFRP